MSVLLSKEETAQLEERIALFENLAQTQGKEWMALLILKEVQLVHGRTKDALWASKRLATAYVNAKKYGLAAKEYRLILQQIPDDLGAKVGLLEIQGKMGPDVPSLKEEAELNALRSLSPAEHKARRRAELEAEAWGDATPSIPSARLGWLCWISATLLNWNLPGRTWLVNQWVRYRKDRLLKIRKELAFIVRSDATDEARLFALEMAAALPRGSGGHALCDLLPLEPNETGDHDDVAFGRRQRTRLIASLGPCGATQAQTYANFANEVRAALPADS